MVGWSCVQMNYQEVENHWSIVFILKSYNWLLKVRRESKSDWNHYRKSI